MKLRHLTGKLVPILAIAGLLGSAAFGQSVELWQATGFNGPESVAKCLRIPTHSVGCSDSIRSVIPEYPVT